MYEGRKQGKIVAYANTHEEVQAAKNNPIYRDIAWTKQEAPPLPADIQADVTTRTKNKVKEATQASDAAPGE